MWRTIKDYNSYSVPICTNLGVATANQYPIMIKGRAANPYIPTKNKALGSISALVGFRLNEIKKAIAVIQSSSIKVCLQKRIYYIQET